jgi:dihydroorotase
MSGILISGGDVIDRSGRRRADVRIADGTIVEVGDTLVAAPTDRVVDAAGLVVSPGFVDLHTHLREPGKEEAETIETGSRAAAKGGYTCVVAMPNTDPTQDSVSVVEFVRRQGEVAGLCDVRPSGSITVGRRGDQLTPMAELAAVGVHLFTDDGNGVQDPLLMRRALEYALDLGVVLAQHCEVARLTEGAVMHEGHCCSRLGLPGWPSLAEELMVYRDIELVRITGAPVHILHLSTAGSVELVRRAKADGLPVTAEATPHHISLTDELLAGYSSLYKVNPPLRTMADVDTRFARAWPTARSTRSPPTTPHMRPRPRNSPSTRHPPGCSASRRRSACASPTSTCRSSRSSPRCPGSRLRSPASATGTAVRWRLVSPRTSPCSTRRSSGRCARPSSRARVATPRTSGCRSAVGYATPSSTAPSWCSTERRSDDTTRTPD